MSERTQNAHRRRPAVIALVVVGAPVVLWVAPMIAALVDAIALGDVEHLYLFIGGFVVFDAVIPVFPSESLLTSASNLAAQDGSDIVLWQLIVAGTVGAIIGDSLLYWLSRTVLRSSMAARVDRARADPRLERGLAVVDDAAETLIVFGRFVPGLRFVVGASMGLMSYPYRRFLVFDAIGGAFWATYTCVFSYLVASIIDGKPIISFATSVIVTTALLGFLYVPLKHSIESTRASTPAVGTT